MGVLDMIRYLHGLKNMRIIYRRSRAICDEWGEEKSVNSELL